MAQDSLDPWGPADPLAEALHLVRMDGAFYCRSELTAPWGMTLPSMPSYLWFHVVVGGRAWLEAADEDPRPLGRGELALVTHGEGHVLRGDLDAPTPGILELELEQVSDRYEILRHGGGGDPTTLVCGAVRFEHPAARNLVQALPPVIHVEPLDSPELEWIQTTVRLMALEARQLRPAGEAVITRLADVIVVQAIRSWIESDPAARTGWLGALRDRQIGRAIALIHRHPARDWTVASLAAEVAMSRSALSARFTELVGEPVMQYVTRWRMNVAVSALREEDVTVAELADRLGYRSEAAFSRAFKRTTGIPPGTIRRSERASKEAGVPGNRAEADAVR